MNLISFLGDVLHLASIFILLVKMFATRSSKGISRKTQVLYAVVFVTRYLDLGHMLYKVFVLFKLPSLVMTYLSLMKVLYIGSSIFIVYLMYVKPPFSKTYNRELDKVRMEMLMIPCFLLAMIWNEKFTIEEVRLFLLRMCRSALNPARRSRCCTRSRYGSRQSQSSRNCSWSIR